MQAQSVPNPFALLLDPASVVAQMEGSERLSRLSSRICRPLDKPHPADAQTEARADDSDLVIDSDGSAERIV